MFSLLHTVKGISGHQAMKCAVCEQFKDETVACNDVQTLLVDD